MIMKLLLLLFQCPRVNYRSLLVATTYGTTEKVLHFLYADDVTCSWQENEQATVANLFVSN